jgi:hypothetical protein
LPTVGHVHQGTTVQTTLHLASKKSLSALKATTALQVSTHLLSVQLVTFVQRVLTSQLHVLQATTVQRQAFTHPHALERVTLVTIAVSSQSLLHPLTPYALTRTHQGVSAVPPTNSNSCVQRAATVQRVQSSQPRVQSAPTLTLRVRNQSMTVFLAQEVCIAIREDFQHRKAIATLVTIARSAQTSPLLLSVLLATDAQVVLKHLRFVHQASSSRTRHNSTAKNAQLDSIVQTKA